MANRFARKTGNWNASDVWSDTPSGTAGAQYIPGVGDVAIANSYTAPDNAGIVAIKAKTDNLPVDPASQASVSAIPTAPLLAADYTAPDNAGIAATIASIAALHDFDPETDTVAYTNISSILGQSLTGSGTSADPWRPA